MTRARTHLRRPPFALQSGGARRYVMGLFAVAVFVIGAITGCQEPQGPIFPEVTPAIEWPPRPDQARIRYVGQLRGEASLGARPQGWEAVKAVLAGPKPQVEFSRPSAVAVSGERVFVADTGLGVIHRLDLATRQYKLMRGAPNDPLKVPLGMAISEGRLVVVDRGRAAVDVFDLEGNWRTTKRWPELAAPVAVAWDAEHRTFWLADAAAHRCFATGDLQTLDRHIGERGNDTGQFNYPSALAWDKAIGLAVVDAMNFRIQIINDTGRTVGIFGQKGDAAGDFSRPRGAAVDSEGHIYVLDNQFENIQIFDRAGRLLMAFGEEGNKPGQFALPSGITIDDRDRIWVADSSNRRVQVFQYLPEKAPCMN
ncbi:MAG TPA: 6-bladed beta-propeller [Phycisphaerae bacterium]|nr:6-bladed beta-propeller [Phycisphaerae bacterium]